MSGAVFHPGHDALHGITVVLFTKGPKTFVGRWDAERDGMAHLFGVAEHEEGQSEQPRDEWVAATKKYGVAVAHQSLAVPAAEVEKVVPLREA